jgi:hypothetical protein
MKSSIVKKPAAEAVFSAKRVPDGYMLVREMGVFSEKTVDALKDRVGLVRWCDVVGYANVRIVPASSVRVVGFSGSLRGRSVLLREYYLCAKDLSLLQAVIAREGVRLDDLHRAVVGQASPGTVLSPLLGDISRNKARVDALDKKLSALFCTQFGGKETRDMNSDWRAPRL